MIAWLLQVTGLVAVYLLTLGSLHPLDLALGAVLAVALLHTLRGFRGPAAEGAGGSVLGRMAAFPVFAAAVVADIVRGTVEVSLVVLGRRPLVAPGIVEVPIGERTPAGVAVSALATTLSPGAVLMDVDWERRVMILHVLDASDPEAVRAEHQRLYERRQRAVFP